MFVDNYMKDHLNSENLTTVNMEISSDEEEEVEEFTRSDLCKLRKAVEETPESVDKDQLFDIIAKATVPGVYQKAIFYFRELFEALAERDGLATKEKLGRFDLQSFIPVQASGIAEPPAKRSYKVRGTSEEEQEAKDHPEESH
jgi:hypothetical protein